MRYEGLGTSDLPQNRRWARFKAEPGENESSQIGYLAAGNRKALDKFPVGHATDTELYFNQVKARHIVVGNVMLLRQLSVSP